MNNARRYTVLIVTLIAIIGMIAYLEIKKPRRSDGDAQTIAITPPPAPTENVTSSPIAAREDRSAILREKN